VDLGSGRELDDLAFVVPKGEPVPGTVLRDLVEDTTVEAEARVVTLRLDHVTRAVVLGEGTLGLRCVAADEDRVLAPLPARPRSTRIAELISRRASLVPATTMVLERSSAERRA